MKRIILILSALAATTGLWAATITPEQAIERLTRDVGAHKVRTMKPATQKPVFTAYTSTNAPAIYIFNNADSNGFMLLSADDSAAPLLGYSDSGAFSEQNMPEAMRWWLGEYARGIEFLSAHSSSAFRISPQTSTSERKAIEPMLTTRWDQIEPFNNLCPLSDRIRTYAGCVATSVAQVMNYWQYPEVGQGSISYNDASLGKRITLNFSKQVFDWNNMLDDYSGTYNETQATAVATLTRAAAYSVKMNFSTSASSAFSLNVAEGMIKYFNYDPNARYAVRGLYSASEWEDMIYDNLLNVGPVIYGGTSMMGGGHSFVCDGYDGNGYFHFNWGWSGMSNGYFLLDALSPSSLGSGGGTGGGYNFSQDAVLGVQPPTGDPVEVRPFEIIQGGSLDASVKDSKLTFSLVGESSGSFLNYATIKVNVTFGAKFETEGAEPIIAPIDHAPLTLNSGYGTTESFVPTIDLSALDLNDGTYTVTIMTDIAENGDFGWLPVRPLYGYSNQVKLTKRGDKYTVGADSYGRVNIVSADIVNTLYFGGMAHVKATVGNDSDIELTRGLAPALFYSPDEGEPTIYFLGSSQMVTVAPHSQISLDWITELTALVPIISMNHDAELKLTFFDEATYNYYTSDIFKTVVMKPNPGMPNMRISGMTVENGTSVPELVNGKMTNVWKVDDKLDIRVGFKASIFGNVPFCYNMIACLLGNEVDESGGIEIHAYNGQPVIMDPGAPAYNFSTSIEYPFMEADSYYQIIPAFIFGTGFVPLTDKTIIVCYDPNTGVHDVNVDTGSDEGMPIHNILGVDMGTSYESLPAGIYIRNGKKILKRNN